MASSFPPGSPESVRAAGVATEFVAGLPQIDPCPSAGDEAVETDVGAVNPRGVDFPGGRGPEMLVVYETAFGPRTGTNPWGVEAMVGEGIVTHVGGNDSLIPSGGFVVSGHGRGKDWILKNLLPGDEVDLRGHRLIRRRTLRSRLWHAAYLTSLARQEMERSRANGAGKPAGEQLAGLDRDLQEARDSVEAGADDAASRVGAVLQSAERIYYGAHGTRSPEVRGVWVRLEPEGPAAPEAVIKTLASAHLNLVLPETVYYGRTIYPPAPDSPLDQWEEFRGTDPLQRLIDAAHGQGIQVHAWVHVFFVGFKDSPLVAEYPDWLARDRQGRAASVHEIGYYFFQPSDPEARALLLATLEDLVRRYELDGLQLDYIRYPNVPDDREGYDYSESTREQFAALTGRDPLDLSPGSTPDAWASWVEFRESAVTSFVREAHERMTAIRPGLQLSAAVFPSLEEARGHKMQNWQAWVDAGWLGFVSPMAYFTDAPPVEEATRTMRALLGPRFPIYTGVGPYLGLPPSMVVDQVEASREGDADGVIFFSHNTMNPQQYGALAAGVFQKPAAIPSSGTSADRDGKP